MTEWTKDEQKEHRRLWVEALRSGKYEQGRGQLRSASGFCCLGVACEISGIGEWTDENIYRDRFGMSATILTSDVRDWLGLRHANSVYGEYNTDQLTIRNDEGENFAQIADIIESEPEGLLAE